MSRPTIFIHLVLVCSANFFTSLATLTPSTLPSSHSQVVKDTSFWTKPAKDDIPAEQFSAQQPEAVVKESHRVKRMRLDLNLVPVDTEVLEVSPTSIASSDAAGAAGSSSISNSSKRFRPTVGSDDPIKSAPNLHRHLPLDGSLAPDTDLSLAARNGATAKSLVPLVPPVENVMAAQPSLSRHSSSAPMATSFNGPSRVADIQEGIVVQKSDTERAQTTQKLNPTFFNTKKKLGRPRHTKPRKAVDFKKTGRVEGGASSTGKVTGSKKKSVSGNDGSHLSGGPPMHLDKVTSSGEKKNFAVDPENIQAMKVFEEGVQALKRAPTKDKNIELAKLLKKVFENTPPKPEVENHPHQGKDHSDLELSSSPYEIFKCRFQNFSKASLRNLTRAKNFFRSYLKQKDRFDLAFDRTEGFQGYQKLTIMHNVLLLLGITEFESVKGHESVIKLFTKVYQKKRSTSSRKLLSMNKSPTVSDNHRNLTPEHTSNIKSVGKSSEIQAEETMSISTLRDEVLEAIKERKLKQEILSSIEATMIFFYFHRYAQQMLQVFRTDLQVSSQASHTRMLDFMIEFWSKFFGLQSPVKKRYEEELKKVGISMDDEQRRMKNQRKHSQTQTEIEWAYFLLKWWLALDPASKTFSDTILPSGKGSDPKRFFCTIMKSQGLLEYMHSIAGDIPMAERK